MGIDAATSTVIQTGAVGAMLVVCVGALFWIVKQFLRYLEATVVQCRAEREAREALWVTEREMRDQDWRNERGAWLDELREIENTQKQILGKMRPVELADRAIPTP